MTQLVYFSGQGRVYIGNRDGNGNPQSMRWLGDVSELKVSLNIETIDHKESYSGQRLSDMQIVKSKNAEFSCILDNFSTDTLELALYGQTSSVGSGTVTNETLPSGLVAGSIVLLANQFVSNVTLIDANGNGAITQGTHYKVHAEQGAIEFLNVGSFVQPFKANYSYGATKRVAMFKSARPDVWLRFDGLNTADGNNRVIVDLYRVVFNPTKEFSLIGDDIQKFELDGLVLADSTKIDNSTLGLFGRVILAA
jgi:hypothetical protein